MQQARAADRFIVLAAVMLLAVFMLRVAWVSDDAFITLRTVRNLVAGDGLTWNPGERLQVYSHPLWMLLLGAGYLFTREPFYTVIAISFAVAVMGVWVLVRRLAPEPGRALLGVALMLTSTSYLDFSSSGLENPLSHLLLLVFATLWLTGPGDGEPRRRRWLALVAGLAVLNRMDTLLVYLPALALMAWRHRGWATLRTLALGFAPFLAWEVFSLLYYGFLFPNPAYAKLGHGLPAGEVHTQGLLYLVSCLGHDPVQILTIALGVAVPFAFDRQGQRTGPLAAGMVLYLVYVVTVGGDFMVGRFLTVPFCVAVALLVTHVPLGEGAARFWPAALLGLAGWFVASRPAGDAVDRRGVADERRVYAESSLLHASREGMPAHPWVALGRSLVGAEVKVYGSVGYIGYYASPETHLVDELGVADLLLARLPAMHNPSWRTGHLGRLVPEGYVETIRTGQDHFADRDLGRYYADLRLVARGPLLSSERLAAIWRLNSGADDALIDRAFYHFPRVIQLTQAEAGQVQHRSGDSVRLPTVRELHEGSKVIVRLSAPSHAPWMQIALAAHDQHRVTFRLAGQDVGQLRMMGGAADDELVLRSQRLRVPASAVDAGYDEIEVLPTAGHDGYFFGDLELLEQL